MADLRIVDAPEIPTEDITGEEKLPTGGSGNYSISLDSLADYTKTKKDLVDNITVDGKVNGVRQELDAHIEDLLNPHQVTKGQIGLGNVDNTADADKPVSNSTQAAIISAVAPKADKTYVDTALSSKTDKTYVDNQLTLKANKADVYTKLETYTKQESSDLVNNSISTALTPINTSLDLAKRGIANSYDSSLTYNSGERVVLVNGDIVKSTIDGNLSDPNTDMTGWILDNAASRIKFSDATSVQGLYDAYKLKDYVFVTPEMFGAVANSWETDNTAALNVAFATGKDVYSTPDKVYTCNGNLRTQGQRCVGGWKIRSSKAVVGTANWTNVSNTYPTPCDYTYLQCVYCAYAYDLAELFAIRDLGYNTLLHYGGMHINGYDMDGTVQNLLDNAKTAGLQVFLGTQNSLNGMTLTDFVNAYKDHPSVLGFLIADEPTHNGVTVAQQQTKIDTMRAITTKPLACSDFTFDAFTEVLADGYDYIFGDIYNDAGETAEQTLYKMRSWLGLTTKRHANSKILPAVMGFKYNSGVDLETIINTSKIFAKACGGNFSCFGWDVLGESSISNGIRDTVSLQKLSKDICSYKTGVYSIPECYAWGAVTEQTSQVNYGLNDVISNYVRSDPYTVGQYEGINSYPAQMNGDAVEGGRTTPYISTGQAISGIWFKHTFGAYMSDIKMKKKNHFTVQSGMLEKGAADVILSVRGSSGGGYNLGSVLAELPKSGEVATVVFDNNGINDTFCIKYDCSVDPQFYRTFVRGVFITSDW